MKAAAVPVLDIRVSQPLIRLGLMAALAELDAAGEISLEPSPGQAAAIVITDDPQEADATAHDRLDRSDLTWVYIHERASAERIQRALRCGVRGHLLLSAQDHDVRDCVRTVSQGGRYLMKEVALRLAEGLCEERLTEREQQVLRLLSQGLCNKRVARQMDIAVGTVKTHVRGLFAKLDVSTRTEAVVVARRRGWVS